MLEKYVRELYFTSKACKQTGCIFIKHQKFNVCKMVKEKIIESSHGRRLLGFDSLALALKRVVTAKQ